MSAVSLAVARALVSPMHRKFRVPVVVTLAIGVVASAATFVVNDLTATATLVIGAAPGVAVVVPHWIARISRAVGFEMAWSVIVLLALAALVRIVLQGFYDYAVGWLYIRSGEHTEEEVFAGLLQKPREFFATHGTGEILSRMATDVRRACRIRPDVLQIVWHLLVVTGNLVFFFSRSPWFGLLATAICGAGTLFARRLMKPLQERDRALLGCDDRVRARIKESVEAVEEIRVGRLHALMLLRLRAMQRTRAAAYMDVTRLDAVMRASNAWWQLLAFITMFGAVQYLRQRGGVSEADSLLPVIVWAIPSIFVNAADFVVLNMTLRMADTSVVRLSEYMDTARREHSEGVAACVAPAPLVLEAATYRYRATDGTLTGGVVDVSHRFRPGTWSAIVGRSGSGKSTLLGMLLGLTEPLSGSIRFGGRRYDELSEQERAGLLSFLPQKPVLFDGDVLENLALGLRDRVLADPAELTPHDNEVLEATGLGPLCRVMALDARIADASVIGGTVDLAAARRELGRRIVDEIQCSMRSYEDDWGAADATVLENVLRLRADRSVLVDRLLSDAGRTAMSALTTEAIETLTAFAAAVLHETSPSLLVANYEEHRRLATTPLPAHLWDLRAEVVKDGVGVEHGDSPVDLALVALTMTPSEVGDSVLHRLPTVQRVRELLADAKPALERLLAGASARYDERALNPYLTLRENLVFANPSEVNHRTQTRIDLIIIDALEELGLKISLTAIGLRRPVGVQGESLSGGQRQLVALARALLRDTPILVLDEPSSALDPARRADLAALLHRWKEGRVVITVTHDPALAKEADDVLFFELGRLESAGPFNDLVGRSELFRRVLDVR